MKTKLLALLLGLVTVALSADQVSVPRFVSRQLRLPVAGGGLPTPDTIAPVVTITAPTAGTTHNNGNVSTINLGGTATDNVQVASCTGSSNQSGAFSVTLGGGLWSASIPLTSGVTNTLTIQCADPSGNTHSDALDVSYTAPSGGAGCDGSTTCMEAVTSTAPAVDDVLTITGFKLLDEGAKIASAQSWWLASASRYGFEKGPNGGNTSTDGFSNNGVQPVFRSTAADKLMGNYSAEFHSLSNVTCWQNGCGQSYSTIFSLGFDVSWRFAIKMKLASDGATGGPDRWPGNYSKIAYNVTGPVCNPGCSHPIMDWFSFAGGGSFGPNLLVQDYSGWERTLPHNFTATYWNWIECHWKKSQTSDYSCWVNDRSLGITGQPGYDSTPIGDLSFGVVNAGSGSTGQGWDFYQHMDNMIAITGSGRIYPSVMVEVCNNATYASATTCVYQPPTNLSDTAVSFVFKKSYGGRTLSSGGAWLHLRSNSQVQATPIAVTVP